MTQNPAIPEDEDTSSLFRHPVKVGDYEATLDIWRWEGIEGWSYIFDQEAVAKLPEETLVSWLQDSLVDVPELTQAAPTVVRRDGHLFVNFCKEHQCRPRVFDPVDRRTPEEKARARAKTCAYLKEHNQREIDRAKGNPGA